VTYHVTFSLKVLWLAYELTTPLSMHVSRLYIYEAEFMLV